MRCDAPRSAVSHVIWDNFSAHSLFFGIRIDGAGVAAVQVLELRGSRVVKVRHGMGWNSVVSWVVERERRARALDGWLSGRRAPSHSLFVGRQRKGREEKKASRAQSKRASAGGCCDRFGRKKHPPLPPDPTHQSGAAAAAGAAARNCPSLLGSVEEICRAREAPTPCAEQMSSNTRRATAAEAP